MTQEQKIIRAKLGLLELAKQLGNVSQACKMMGYSRDRFYPSRSSTIKAASWRCRRSAGANPRRRDRQTLPFQRFRYPHVAPGRLLDRHVDHRLFDLSSRAVFQHRWWTVPLRLPILGATDVARQR